MLKTLVDMTAFSPQSNTPSSISLNDHWEAIRVNDYFIFQQRRHNKFQLETNAQIIRDKDGLIAIECSNNNIEALQLDIVSSDRNRSVELSQNDTPTILSQIIETTIHNIPKSSTLVIR